MEEIVVNSYSPKDPILEKINELGSITKDNILIINIINKRLTDMENHLADLTEKVSFISKQTSLNNEPLMHVQV